MAAINVPVPGFSGNVMVSANRGAFVNLGWAKNQTITVNAEPLDSTNYQSRGWMTHTVGLRSWEVSVESLYVDSDAGLDLIRSTLLAPLAPGGLPPYMLSWGFFPIDQGVAPTGTTYYTGIGMVSSFEIDDPVDDVISVSLTITGSGQMTQSKTTAKPPKQQEPQIFSIPGI